MQTLILPGYSAKNKDWVDDVADNLKTDDTIRPFYWMHWTDDNSKFDPEEKAQLIAKHIKGDKVNIIAKSVGTLIASYLYQIIPQQVGRIVLCGIPVNDLQEEEIKMIKQCLSSNKDKFICFQNSNDPHGTYEQISDFGNVRLFEGDTHEYPYFADIQKFLEN